MKVHLLNKGFTLIELLITISIVGILATVVTFGFPSAQKLARDNTRKSDLKQCQTVLENYASGSPGMLYTGGCGSCPSSGPLGDSYICIYYNDGTAYALSATLEKPISAAKPYFIICSNGKVGTSAILPSSSCPI